MRNRILITGATGNIGNSIIKLINTNELKNNDWSIAVRNANKLCSEITENFEIRKFDFEDTTTYTDAFKNIDVIFLLRPPHIADVKKYFLPLLTTAKTEGIKKIVFLSVQGADKKSFIPHSKIEKLIKQMGFEYIFLRPSYFMQNLTTTLKEDIKNGCICLPSGNAVFNWVDIEDIAKVAIKTLINFDLYKNKAITITGPKNLGFKEVVDLINKECNINLKYKSINPIKFIFYKKKQGEVFNKIMVMILLHFMPRFEKVPYISNDYELVTGNKPNEVINYIIREKYIIEELVLQ